MPQTEGPAAVLLDDEGDVDRRYESIMHALESLIPDHRDVLLELDGVVSELLALADDRARVPGPRPADQLLGLATSAGSG